MTATAHEVVATVIAGLLLAAGLMVTLRMVLGPSTLDRAVALDALVAVVMAGIGLQTAVRGNAFYLPVLLVLSFLGFTGSVGVARFMALRDEAGTGDVDESQDTGEEGNGDQDNGAAGDARSAEETGRRPGQGPGEAR
ncbi:monovalent cation/H+ antiporter complex subunit F [Streptomyces tubbatahanensis]|uniref:Monovalent cation/H+ antiporter complex subunit F n=1 Tax=Streptomyces tubbatahanensis TaxID=2923272 RepID=A0ABY3Y2S0_9ACTN|nr:monovalent cation/H+ antiporter complex subunit F [Streptomyces tubbatahanensis]UNT00929.1 monovalent cation/H+ antiporter complex subunit F [Streptomyces tubbatahanensis]